jgi:hypothetical protein
MHQTPFILLTAMITVAFQSIIVSGATVGHWKFEHGVPDTLATDWGTVLDYSGNGINGTPLANPVYRQAIPGSSQVALQFTSGNQRVFFEDLAALSLTGSMTIEATIRYDGFPATNDWGLTQIFFRGDDRGGNDPYYFAIDTSNRLNFLIQGSPGFDPSVYSVIRSAPLDLGRWYRVAAMLNDATGRQSIFIDGIETVHTITTIRPMANLDPSLNPGVAIGNIQSATWSEAFGGLIDEVRLKNSAELTPVEPIPEPSTFCITLLMGALPAVRRRKNKAVLGGKTRLFFRDFHI